MNLSVLCLCLHTLVDFVLKVYSLYDLCWQGEVGVGVPGSRGERGEPGPRVSDCSTAVCLKM